MCLYRKLLLLLICSCAYSGNMLAQTDEYAVDYLALHSALLSVIIDKLHNIQKQLDKIK